MLPDTARSVISQCLLNSRVWYPFKSVLSLTILDWQGAAENTSEKSIGMCFPVLYNPCVSYLFPGQEGDRWQQFRLQTVYVACQRIDRCGHSNLDV